MDAYSRIRGSKVYAVGESSAPFSTRSGLTFIPDQAKTASGSTRLLPALPKAPAGHAIDRVLDGIVATYGNAAADHVANGFEYARDSN
jgi:hypothetical protein